MWKWIFWKPYQRLEAAAEKCSGKYKFLKCRKILKDYKSEQNPLKMLKGVLFGKVAGPSSATLPKKNSTTSFFQFICRPFKNTAYQRKIQRKE